MRETIKEFIGKLNKLGHNEFHSAQLAAIFDGQALTRLPDLGVGYLPWSSFALRPSAVTALLNEITLHKATGIIECGIGISTMYALHPELGSSVRLLGIDDNEDWISTVDGYLKRMGVPDENYRLVHAPITDMDDPTRRGAKWYDKKVVHQASAEFFGQSRADLLLVDGPKGNLCEQSRYGALPALHEFLSEDFAVFLDDIIRVDELAISVAWSREYNLDLQHSFHRGGIAILRPSTTKRSLAIF